MKKLTFSHVTRIYLITLGILSFWFMTEMAMANPLCSNCSVNLVAWALPRAEILMVGWIIAGMGTVWSYRVNIISAFRHLNFLSKGVARIKD